MSYLLHKMEQIRKLKNGVGVQTLLDEAYKILENPIAMINTEYKLLAYTEVVTDDPIWIELVTHGTFSKQTQEFFFNEGFVEASANAARLAFMKSDKLKYDRINGKLFSKNNTHISNLVVVACNRPFEESDSMIFEAICKLLSKEISQSEIYQEYEQEHQETTIRSLIDGDCDIKFGMGQVGILYDTLESGLYIVVADISMCSSKQTDVTYFRNLLMQTEPAYKYAVYSDYIIIVASTNSDNFDINKELSGLIKVFRQYNMYAGISSRFENLFELQKYFKEAYKAMRFALKTGSSQHIFPCNQSSTIQMEQIDNITNGEGIKYFLDTGFEIFGNPLLFHDMELNLLAYTESAEIKDPIWEELITYGTSSDETIQLFKTEGFISTMENTKGGAVLISEKIKYDRISWRIYSNDNIMIGCLSIVNTDKQFSEDELVLFGAFSQKFSKEVGKIDFYNNYGQVYSDTVINRLISGKIDDYTFYSEDIGNLYSNLMDNLYLIAVDMSQCNPEHASLTYIRELFNWQGALNRYAIYSDYIIIITSIDSVTLNEKNKFNEIGEVFKQHNIYAGISSRFENIYELRKHYNEAVTALRSKTNNLYISLYDEIGSFE